MLEQKINECIAFHHCYQITLFCVRELHDLIYQGVSEVQSTILGRYLQSFFSHTPYMPRYWV